MPVAQTPHTTLRYDDLGEGPPLVVIHGAAGAARNLAPVLPRLAERHRVLAPDLRGMGGSGRVGDDMPPGAWADDIGDLLDHLELESAHLAGVSLGARVVARFAIDHPERARSLTVDAPILFNETGGSDALNARFTNLDDSHPSAASWRDSHGEDWPEVVAQYGRTRRRDDLQDHYDVRAGVASTVLPTLIVRGDVLSDVVHPYDHAVEWHRLRPESWLWIRPGSAGTVMANHPEEFAAVHARFLAAQVPGDD